MMWIAKRNTLLILPQGDDLIKLIIGLSFKYDIIKIKEEKIFFSKKYQVLSKYTTIFSEIENDNERSTQNTMKTIQEKIQLETR